ncbi:lipid IV(A) 3-deoxy-D-manno-octulosonic acid transferase [Phytohalomonas tamaricis]|uniref:lipid IV(A) 3-deoxy-D-manno-octulosonic acid transferase n=1 Tax=Phytohalomonas tamaricis TaxID=2081032 RepID=UPI000D0ADC80|nr:lipid IV(A) 3-deoxy-D-manno-octulosonic acid transferase [Phytohalomonas tamaricis]
MRRRLYSSLLYALSPLIWRRVWRESLPTHPRRERLGRIPDYGDERIVWVHAASVGEALTAQPLIRSLIDDYPDHRVVVTTMTATGAQRIRALFEDKVSHHFVPLDFPRATKRFITRLNPELAIIVETEIWPNLMRACGYQGVPAIIVNGRLSPKAFKRYLKLGPLMRDALRWVRWVGAKSGDDAKRFRALGLEARDITVTGSLKYDLSVNDAALDESQRLRQLFGTRPVWIAASTHPGEDEQVLAAHAQLSMRFNDALLILVPRHPQRFDDVAALCQERGFHVARRSAGDQVTTDTQVYLGDTMGELMALYGAADLAFVGGSLVEIGGHNLLEPAALGVPVLSGPHLNNFSEIATTLREADALIDIVNADTLVRALMRLLEDDAARHHLGQAGKAVVDANRGALERTRAGIARLLMR